MGSRSEGHKSQSGSVGAINFVPERLIASPVIFRGMSDEELVTTAITGLFFWVPVSCLICSLFGITVFGLAIGFGLALCTVLFAGRFLTRIKRRMPDGLHVVYIKRSLQNRGLFNFGYLNSSQRWDIRRTRPVDIDSELFEEF